MRGSSYDISVGNWNRGAVPSPCLEEMRRLRVGWGLINTAPAHTHSKGYSQSLTTALSLAVDSKLFVSCCLLQPQQSKNSFRRGTVVASL